MLSEQIFVLLGGKSVKYADFLRLCPKCVLPCLLIQFQDHILSADCPNSDVFLECHLQKVCGQHP